MKALGDDSIAGFGVLQHEVSPFHCIEVSGAKLVFEPVPEMRRVEVEVRPLGHDAGRIEGFVAAEIMALYVVHAHRTRHAGNLEKIAGVAPQIGVIRQATPIAFEMTVVNRIEAHQGREQTPVRLGDALAKEITSGR